MSLRDFNEPSQPISSLHTDPSGNGAGLNSFHTTHPEVREPNNTPKIVGAVAVALMVGAAGIGLYAYSGPSSPKPVVADNNLPQPPATAPAPVAPPPAPQQAANMPADASAPAAQPAAADNTPAPAPVKEASAKPIRHHKALSHEADTSTADSSASASSSQMASSAAQTRLNADSTGSTIQPPQQQAVTAPSTTPLPAAPQPSPSDVASNNSQATQPAQTPAPATPAVQPPAQQQPAQQAPAPQQPEQAGAAPAQPQ